MPHLYNSLTFKLSSHALAFFAALLFSLPAAVFAQRPVQGKVVDAATGEPLAGAIVQMKGASVQTATDSAGGFELIFPNSGNLFVQVEQPGFYKKTARAKMGEPLVVALKKNEGAPNPRTFERKVSGKIVDRETCQPVAGANILVKGTSLAIATGEDGSFEFALPDSLPTALLVAGREVRFTENETLFLDLTGAKLTPDCRLIANLPSSLAPLKFQPEDLGAATDPVQLLQAAVPGLMVTQPGSDPNGEYLLRLRGISTFVQRSQPLLVVDGLPEASWDLVSPDDIASVTVLGSAAAAARYGIRGAAGVVSVETKKGKATGEPAVRYHAFLARQSLSNELETATPEEFISWGGTDFGGRVDWMDEITRTPFSNSHHLSVSSGGEHFDLRASAGLRSVQGILKESGYRQINGRVSLRQSAFGDRLRFSANLATASREMDFSIPTAFQHATAFHPTAPIFGASPLGRNHDGYFETEAFGSFNPVAILAQNTDEGERKLQSGSLRGELRLADWLWLDATGSLLTEQSKRGGYSGMNSQFWAFRLGGDAKIAAASRRNVFFETALRGERQFGKLAANYRLGWDWQRLVNEGFSGVASEFISDAFLYHNLNFGQGFSRGNTNGNAVHSFKNEHKMAAASAQASLGWNGILSLDAGLRREGSSHLPPGKKWGWFHQFAAGVELKPLLRRLRWLDRLHLEAGKGVAGGLPLQGGLWQLQFKRSGKFFYNGGFVPSIQPSQEPNPDLTFERRQERFFGLKIALFGGRLEASAERYASTADRLIDQEYLPDGEWMFSRYQYRNAGKLSNRGWALSLAAAVFSKNKLEWTMGLRFSTCQSKVLQIDSRGSEEIYLFSPDGFDLPTSYYDALEIAVGHEPGLFETYQFDGLDENGNWKFADLDGDNFVPEYHGDRHELTTLPNSELGLRQSLHWGRFDLQAWVRGVFGHRLLNGYRLKLEDKHVVTWRNVVKTDRFLDQLESYNTFSDYFLEKASFLKLDYLALGYRLPLKNGNLRLYLAARNLLTITGYQGVDPEPRLENEGETYVSGIERGDTYFPARTVGVGVEVSF